MKRETSQSSKSFDVMEELRKMGDRDAEKMIADLRASPLFLPAPTKQSEHEVCEDLRAWWKAREFYVIRNQQGIGSKKGLSDYTVIKNGKVLFVEAKATKGKQNDNQIAFQAGVEREGGTYILAHSLHEFVEGWNRAWKP